MPKRSHKENQKIIHDFWKKHNPQKAEEFKREQQFLDNAFGKKGAFNSGCLVVLVFFISIVYALLNLV